MLARVSRPPRQGLRLTAATRRLATDARQRGRGTARGGAQREGRQAMRGKPAPAAASARRGGYAQGRPGMKKAAASGAAAALANSGRGKFLREDEDDLLEDDEDLDDLDDIDMDALPEGTAPTRGAVDPEDFAEERITAEKQEEDEVADELDDAEELERLTPEEREMAKLDAAKSDTRILKRLGASPDDVKRMNRIIRGIPDEEVARAAEEDEKDDNPNFFDSSESELHQERDRHVVVEAMFRGFLKQAVPDQARAKLDERTLFKMKKQFMAEMADNKFTHDELKQFADTEFKAHVFLVFQSQRSPPDYQQQVLAPVLDAVEESQQVLKEMNIEQFFASPEEAQKSSDPVLALGNKWVPAPNFVRIKQQEFDAFFPEGVAGSLDKEWLLMNNRRNILVREPAVEVANALEAQRASRFLTGPSAHFIRGGPGVGKSCVLSSVVYWARKNGWLVVWIPSGFNFVNDGNLQRSRREPLHFDQPEVAMPFLDKFGKGNAHIIGQLPLRTSFTIGVPNVVFTSEGKTMLDLVNFAKESFDYATDAVFYLRHELNLVTEFPVLIAIDDYNLFHDHAVNLYDPDFQKLNPPLIMPEKLVLPSLFQGWQNHGLTNGTMLCAMSNSKPRNTRAFDARFPKLASVFSVERYNRDEFLTVVANYEQNGYIHTPATLETYRYVYHMCAGRGREIYKMLSLY